jgi:D-serine deaminase-like pyridoxal phosphate-dependent protein
MQSPYEIRETDDLHSPSLVVFRSILRDNLDAMIRIAGSPDRLRPHVKTHKMPAIVRLVESLGISRHKCATIAEAEMVARAGGGDVLIAYPLVGPNVRRMALLIQRYPKTAFRATVESASAALALSEAVVDASVAPLPVLVDLDVGMGRTGIDVDQAADLYRQIHRLPGLIADGLHAYDGHIRDTDFAIRRGNARNVSDTVLRLRDQLLREGFSVNRLVLGGTPTFTLHAELDEPGVELSAGTSPLHDHGYASRFPDLPFRPAAGVLTRVVSGPRNGRITLDVGHKAIAADPAGDRLTLPEIPDAKLGPQSEEHLVVETSRASDYPPGTPLLAIPTHICPTCALHEYATVIDDGRLVDFWMVEARKRVLEI